MRRREAVAALAGAATLPVLAQTPLWSLEARRRLTGGAGAAGDIAERQRLAEEGEAALSRGDTEAAQRAFDRAAAIVHSPDIELGLVRTYMQAGAYARALSFAAHAAGAHRAQPSGAALYAWLLHVGSQRQVAQRVIDEALSLRPDDQGLLQVQTLLTDPRPLPAAGLLAPPLRAAPYAVPDSLPAMAGVAGSALLLADGLTAVLPASTLEGARGVWVRNGMGQTVAAVARAAVDEPALAVLELASVLPTVPGLEAPPRAPFAGSPAYTLEYSHSVDGQPAWPLLRIGFFGGWSGNAGDRPLGIELPVGPRGGPVFDARGRLAGLALPGNNGPDRLCPIERVVRAAGLSAPPQSALPASTKAGDRMAADALYEVGMRVTLQVLVSH